MCNTYVCKYTIACTVSIHCTYSTHQTNSWIVFYGSCTHRHTHMHTHTHIHTCTHIHAYIYIHTHTYTHIHTHTYIHTNNTNTHTSACAHARTRTHAHTHTHTHSKQVSLQRSNVQNKWFQYHNSIKHLHTYSKKELYLHPSCDQHKTHFKFVSKKLKPESNKLHNNLKGTGQRK